MTPMGYYPPMPIPTHPQMHPHANYLPPPGSVPPSYYPGYPPPSMIPLASHVPGISARPGYYPPLPNMYMPPGSIYPPPVGGSYPPVQNMYHPHAYNMPNPYINPNINMNYSQLN